MNKKSRGFKPPPKNSRRPKKPTPPPPDKNYRIYRPLGRDKSLDAKFLAILEDAIRHGIGEKEFLEAIIKEYKKPEELPEITEEWIGKKAKEIWQLIKDGQDEDLSDPVTDLHYLGLAIDIVDSIIEYLRPKNK